MTIRNDILNNIAERFEQAQSLFPLVTQGYRYVTREPMCEGMIKNLRPGESALVIMEGTETKTQLSLSSTNAELPMTIEVYYKTTTQDRDWKTRNLSGKLNTILAEVIKIVLSDRQCGNNSLNVYEISNTLDVDGIYDDTVGLETTFLVQYRHRVTDPTQQV